MTAEALELLRELVDELRGLRADLAGYRGPANLPPLRHKDRLLLEKLAPVLATHFLDSFEVWEVIDASRVADVLGGSLRLILGDRTGQQLGQVFARAAGRDFGGVQIVREGRGGNGSKWRCRVTGASLQQYEGAVRL